ncbi:B3/4 domain-containing protein [Nonomuraea purpurea]|uniref:B3/4 domain-containing protein n=1 Tax=Nonomuraea purpurea TaxID=1849276 RepID=A0ABV8GLL4_9ACTN
MGASIVIDVSDQALMRFQHSDDMWRDFPELVPGVIFAKGVSADVSVSGQVARFAEIAAKRLATATEGELPEIQAWRRAFSQMGLKPTQYRCASESLLRRFRKEGALPRLHPLIDLCNAVSIAYAVPVAVFDVSKISGYVEVGYATGDETYLTFSGESEHPPAGEVVFADAASRAHARRWSNRQSGHSAVRDTTTDVLIVAEALHGTALADMESLTTTLADELSAIWPGTPRSAILSASEPRFEFTP